MKNNEHFYYCYSAESVETSIFEIIEGTSFKFQIPTALRLIFEKIMNDRKSFYSPIKEFFGNIIAINVLSPVKILKPAIPTVNFRIIIVLRIKIIRKPKFSFIITENKVLERLELLKNFRYQNVF